MMTKIRRFFAAYVSRWWLPSAVSLALLGIFTGVFLAATWLNLACNPLLNGLFLAVGGSFLGILGAAGWNFIRREIRAGFIQAFMFFFTAAITLVAMGALSLAMMFGPDVDHFADKLTIPPNIEISDPEPEPQARRGGEADTFQAAILAALEKPGNGDATVKAELPSLAKLQTSSPELLRRYLACNPAWRVFRERGEVFATRRWMIGPVWSFGSHGYLTRHDLDTFNKNGLPDFQARVTLGLSGKPWWRGDKDSTRLAAGTAVKLMLRPGNGMQQSDGVVTGAGAWPVEVFEQSGDAERRVTKAALAQMESELAPLAASSDEATLRKQLPPGSVRTGQPAIQLRNSIQPGIYESELWVNPGEPGMVYLKAFEVTKGTPLSYARLKEESNEWAGWSDRPGEQFFSNANFTIYEGDWGKPYAARFEVWFVPDSGKPERKLAERIFKIEGWQR